jgi:hypothetical protein
MAAPTPATRTVAHAAVGVAAALIVPKIVGRGGVWVALASAVITVWLHEGLDAPLAQVMAANGIQF